jgi:hypothetical protein
MTTEQLEVLLLATLAVMSLLALAGIILAGYDCIQHIRTIRTIWTSKDDDKQVDES